MANDNHLSSVTCYNVTMKCNKHYNEFFELGQQKINFNFFKLSLPDDDPVYTLKKVMKEMDFSSLMAQYSNKGRNGFNPIMKYAVLTYANMRGVKSVDRIVELCERDLAFIWLTKGEKPGRDAFYDFKYWGNQSFVGEFEMKQYYMAQIEDLFKDDLTTEGFSTIFDKMYANLDELMKSSGTATTREHFLGSAQNLTYYFNSVSETLVVSSSMVVCISAFASLTAVSNWFLASSAGTISTFISIFVLFS